MSTGKNTKFDLDLEYGQIREKRVADLLKGSKVEIKTERAWWRKTGNIAIEYEYRNKPSGIDKTESKWSTNENKLDCANGLSFIFLIAL